MRIDEKKAGEGSIGVRGFEPPTSRSRTERATSLRYTPILILSHYSTTVFAIGKEVNREKYYRGPIYYGKEAKNRTVSTSP